MLTQMFDIYVPHSHVGKLTYLCYKINIDEDAFTYIQFVNQPKDLGEHLPEKRKELIKKRNQ